MKITDCLPPFCFLQILVFKHCNPFCLSYQDLSSEQARSQELSAEVQHLSRKLQQAEAELKTATVSLNQSQEKLESLSLRLKKSESLLHLEQNSNSESSDNVHICPTHAEETSRLHQTPEAGKGRDVSMTAGKTEQQLCEQLVKLEKEVCVHVSVCHGHVSL